MSDRIDDNGEVVPVLGHMCEGMEKFQRAGVGCAPFLLQSGEVCGCDYYNKVPIEFCPWCGTKLAEDDKGE